MLVSRGGQTTKLQRGGLDSFPPTETPGREDSQPGVK
jgi:hypothetical protein